MSRKIRDVFLIVTGDLTVYYFKSSGRLIRKIACYPWKNQSKRIGQDVMEHVTHLVERLCA